MLFKMMEYIDNWFFMEKFEVFLEKIRVEVWPTYCQNMCDFEISNEYCGLISGPDVLKLKLATSIGVIWRWYEWQGLVFIIFQKKIGPTYCQYRSRSVTSKFQMNIVD